MSDEFDHSEAQPDSATEGDYSISRRDIAAILYSVDANDQAKLIELMEPLHAADIADLLEQLNPYDRRRLVRLYDREFDGDILSELEEGLREEIIRVLSPEVLAEAVRELDSDDVVDLVEDLDEPQQEAILDALEDSDRVAVEQALAYPETSAGRLMQREVVVAPDHWTVGEAIDFLRKAEELPEQFYHVVLVDPRIHPVGNVTLGKLMSSRRNVPLTEIVEDVFQVIPVLQDEADVAYAFNQYHLISAPVVDEDNRLVGVITIDDAMAVLDEEHEEDILRLAGVGDEASLTDTIFEAAKGRALWLFVNLLTAILASLVIDMFAETINQMVALAVLMPIVASMGGNAGTQTMTVAVRALATRDLTAQNAMRVVLREVSVGALNGLIFGGTMALVVALWFGVPMLALVIGLAMLFTQIAAALGGIVIPMALDRAGIDPALASGPFVTTVTDVVGFFAFLGLAASVLM
ncbi:Magnesium transporter MgtE [Thalassovita gelatinovora]|uniref:Magnesium transporter MgtE n=1 Tax=Thalassovita gelatinovora TaxID=53501 RepID=A0A0P1F825_THAGE|nr:magnesium transporter [Thalassovita gelatinovora]QIZ80248.1 magnesium transporter [Thalassovita gelatinovora]CUH64119.1 Magnesium transporter MgtE [Thalassovita gelatinovora]SEQ83722.1 magnesium transporter [Thalassovita gelatinovora]